MPYATGRTCYDADSHLMELSDWLVKFADPGAREKIRPLQLGGAGALAAKAVADAETRRGDPAAAAALEADVTGPKCWSALGAFDPKERSRALDLLGFEKQLVFSSFAATQFFGDDLELLYGGTRAPARDFVLRTRWDVAAMNRGRLLRARAAAPSARAARPMRAARAARWAR